MRERERYTFISWLLSAVRNMEEYGLAHEHPEAFWVEETPVSYLRVRFRDIYGRVPADRFLRAMSKQIRTTRLVKELIEKALREEQTWHGVMARLLLHLWEEHRKLLDSKVLGKPIDKRKAGEVHASLCWLAREVDDLMPELRPGGYGPEGYEAVGLPEGEFRKHMKKLEEEVHRLRERI